MFIVLSFVLFGALFIHSNTVFSKKANDQSVDLSKESYNQMINEGDLPKEVSYEEWLAINDESLFEKLDEEIPMPNIILTPDSTGYFSKSMLTARGFSLQKGDILVTNGTSSYGLTGHAGIAINSSQILHIQGPGKLPSVISALTWAKKYGLIKGQEDGRTRTKVYRVSASTGNSAGN